MSFEDTVTKFVVDSYKSRTTYARPVLKYNDTITVEFAIQLLQIMGLSEQLQVLTLNIWDQVVRSFVNENEQFMFLVF